jgi:hypothetical protein
MTRKYSSISVETTLATDISNTATSMVVATGTGAALMGGVTLAVGNVDQFTVALDVDTQNEEIVFVTNISGDTLTISRGQAGTGTAGVIGIPHTAGATVKHVLTSSDLTFYTAGVATADAAVPSAVVTAKADLLVGASSGVVDNLAVGTNNQVLTADSAQTLGVKWATPASGDVTLTGTQTLTNKTLTDPVVTESVNAQTGTTYTTVLTDAKQMVTLSNASAITVTLPPNSSVAYAAGSKIDFIQKGAGQVTFAQGAGVTIRSTGSTAASPKLRTQYSAATAWCEGSDVWYIVGDIA